MGAAAGTATVERFDEGLVLDRQNPTRVFTRVTAHPERVSLAVYEGRRKRVLEAADRGDLEEIRQVYKEDRDALSWKDPKNGDSVLIKAARRGDTAIVKFALNRKVDFNEVNDESQTALIVAVIQRQMGTIKFLLAQGAKMNKRDDSRFSAKDYAEEMGDKPILALLAQEEERRKTPKEREFDTKVVEWKKGFQSFKLTLK